MSDAGAVDFVEEFLGFTESYISPDLFRLWSGIALVAGALGRRVWVRTRAGPVYPNLYTLLVAPPGVGKYVIEETRNLWAEAENDQGRPAFKIAPDSMTKASLVDSLAAATSAWIPPSGPPVEYNSMLVAAEEFAVLLPSYDLEYLGTLNRIYNNVGVHSEVRRTGSVRELNIINPQLNILGGVQPGWLASVFPEEAWSTGLSSRMIMVYADETPYKDLFEEIDPQRPRRARIIERLGEMSGYYGEIPWSAGAKRRVQEWMIAGAPPAPTHSKLTNYLRRRPLHMLKLATVACVSRAGRPDEIQAGDISRAIAWLTHAESLMPDIFRAMIGKNDMQVVEELHHFMVGMWGMGGSKVGGMTEESVYSFLSQRVPAEKIDRILDMAQKSGVVSRMAGTSMWQARAKLNHGVE